jgi:osmotically-inducible protein OsmY
MNSFTREELLMKTDTQLRQDVLDELEWEPSIDANEIGVAVHNGVVTLTGYVPSYAEKLAAERAAAHVSGVKAIAEEIEVKLPSSSKRTDSEIAEAVVNALKWNPVVKEAIKVKVEDGVVTLTGEVNWNYERDSAKRIVENLMGVRRLINLLRVRARPSVADVKEKIRKAFERAATLDAAQIQVETHDGEVTLKGRVRSMAEYREAATAAWAGPGVTEVRNQLKIV